MPPKKRKRRRTGCGYRRKALLAKQRRARETPEETERRRSAEAARKRRVRAAESHEETEIRRKIQAEMVARRRQREKDKKRLEYKKMMAASIVSFLEEEKERKKARQEEKVQRKASNANGAASLKSKKAIKFIEVHSPQNQQLCHENSWGTLIPNVGQTVFPSYGVKENSLKPNNVSILPSNITETTAVSRAPLVDFGYRSIPVNKLHMWEQAEMCKNIHGGQANNLRAQLQYQNVAETVQFQMNCLRHIYEQFNYGGEFQNSCKSHLKNFTTVEQPEKDDPVQIKMEYAADPSEQFENMENGCEEQPKSSIIGVYPEKDETVHIKMECVTDSYEQFEKVEELKNGCEGQPNSSITGVHHEKDENVQVKMKFAVGSSEQIKNIEPWNMFTVEFSIPNINIETQNDVATSVSVSSSVSDSRNLSKPSVPVSYPLTKESKAEYLKNSIVQLEKVEKLNVCETGDQPNHSKKMRKTRKTDAERAKAYRLRKKAQKPKRPPPKTVAERVKKHKDRKREEKAAMKLIMEAGYEPQAKQVDFLENQQIYQQNSWSRLIPNSVQTVSSSYGIKENSIKLNNVAILPPNITEITRAPLVEFSYRSIPVNKLYSWEQDEMCRNVRGSQPNNLRSHEIVCATVPSEQFENVEQLENGCEEQLRNSIVHPEKETAHIQTEYVTNSSEQFEKLEELKNGCEEQPSCSRTGMLREKDENMQVQMKLDVGSSEQIETIEPWNMFTVDFLTPNTNIDLQNDVTKPISVSSSVSDTKNLSNANLYVPASYPPANVSKAEYLANSIVQFEKVEKLNVCETRDHPNSSGSEVCPETDENIQIKLEFAEDASEHVEPVDL